MAWFPPHKLNAQNAVHPICKTTYREILLIGLGQLLGALAKNNSSMRNHNIQAYFTPRKLRTVIGPDSVKPIGPLQK